MTHGLSVPAVLVASAIGFCGLSATQVDAQSPEVAQPAEWYFVGGTSLVGETAIDLYHPTYDGQTVGGGAVPRYGAERYEFVLTLSDSADPQDLTLSSGQSLAFSVPRDTYTFLVNRTMALDLGTAVTPHFMAGLGLTYQMPDREPAGRSPLRESWQPAFQFGVGASYDLTDSFAISARLRAFYLGGETSGEQGATEGQFSQDFFLGARLLF